ncbi:PREDICTED: uncharacterized protein LOC105570957, partial [Vollenhovia emeryi]|uniref:uncharacterized protein LOC105570957 n=1 Tax=Vollenhovia emeryi TaxID=411798 RepID=UPI0005F3CA96
VLQFADDLVIWAAGKERPKVVSSLAATIEKIDSFLKIKGMELSIHKSSSMNFVKSRRSATEFEAITIKQQAIPLVTEHKFLGIIIDQSFSGKAHLAFITSRCRQITNAISSLAGVWWGGHPTLLLNIYRSILRSIFEYGHQVFFSKGNLTKLESLLKLRNKAIRTAMGYRMSTPVNVMLEESREPPFHTRMELLKRSVHLQKRRKN